MINLKINGTERLLTVFSYTPEKLHWRRPIRRRTRRGIIHRRKRGRGCQVFSRNVSGERWETV